MKIEPQKIKKVLKYAAVGACTVTVLTSTGCELPETPTDTPPDHDGAIPVGTYTPDSSTPTPDINNGELVLSGDIAYDEPDIAGGIPAPDTDVDISGAPPA